MVSVLSCRAYLSYYNFVNGNYVFSIWELRLLINPTINHLRLSAAGLMLKEPGVAQLNKFYWTHI